MTGVVARSGLLMIGESTVVGPVCVSRDDSAIRVSQVEPHTRLHIWTVVFDRR